MSNDQEVSIMTMPSLVDISASTYQTILLNDLFGRTPVEDIRGVLTSEWGRDHGWRVQEGEDAAASVYRRTLEGEGNVELEVRVSDIGQVRVQLSSSVLVEASSAFEAQAAQEQRLRLLDEKAREAVGSVILKALELGLGRIAETEGVEVVAPMRQTINEQQHVQLEVTLRFSEAQLNRAPINS